MIINKILSEIDIIYNRKQSIDKLIKSTQHIPLNLQSSKKLADQIKKFKENPTNFFGKNPLHYVDNYNDALYLITTKEYDINQQENQQNQSPIFYHVRGFIRYENNDDRLKIIKLLINNGANINLKDKSGNTPIYDADEVDSLNILIDNGADIHIKNNNEYIPIMQHLNDKDSRIPKILIDKGADINFTVNNGYTLLHHSTVPEIINLLLIKNPDLINKVDNNGNTPLHININPEKIQILVSKKSTLINTQNNDGDTPLHIAINAAIRGANNENIIKNLLKYSSNITIKNKNNKTPIELLNPYDSNHRKILGIVLKEIEPVNYNNSIELQNQFVFKFLDYIDLLKILIDVKGFNGNIMDTNRDTLLHLATNENVIEYLIDKYPLMINYKDNQGNIPLHIILQKYVSKNEYDISPYYKKIIEKMIEKGADITITNNKNETAMDIIDKKDKMLELIVNKLIDKNLLTDLLFRYINKNNNILVDAILSKDIDFNRKDKDNNTILHLVLRNIVNKYPNDYGFDLQYESSIKKLLAKNVSIDSKNNDGKTPMDIIDDKKYSKLVKLIIANYKQDLPKDLIFRYIYDYADDLIKKNINLNIKNGDGDNPLHYAFKLNSEYGRFAVKKFLDTGNYDKLINDQDGDGNTILHLLLIQYMKNPSQPWMTLDSSYSSFVETLLDKKADLNIKNNKGDTPIDIINGNEKMKTFIEKKKHH